MQYTEAILWYAMWPVLIFVAYKFVMVNLRHFSKMERLEELEARYNSELEQTVEEETLA